jgi:two-component system, OmpR family, sensor histidine kinase MprB
MTFRRRLVIVAASAVAVSVALASGIVYVVVRGELRGRVDAQLRHQAPAVFVQRGRGLGDDGVARAFGRMLPPVVGGRLLRSAPARERAALAREIRRRLSTPTGPLGLPSARFQLVDTAGHTFPPGAAALPVTRDVRAVAAGTHRAFFTDATVAGHHVRLYTAPAMQRGFAVEAARPLDDVDRTLGRLALVLVAVSVGGILIAALLGRVVAGAAVGPVRRLTRAAQHVAETRDLTGRIDEQGGDEIASLAHSFNVMLEALESSVRMQRQLVADASHELRTPLTSVRANVEVLSRAEGMPAAERARLVADIVAQLEELSGLVTDLVELAREEERHDELVDVRLDALVEEAVAQAARRPGAPRFETALDACVVRGAPGRLARAIANLLDNAAKWSPADAAVEITLADGKLAVRDHGPGFDAIDLPHVFDRFYRSASARGQPGSGLGLAIVRQVAEAHGGRVSAENAPGGGALMCVTLPVMPVSDVAREPQLREEPAPARV